MRKIQNIADNLKNIAIVNSKDINIKSTFLTIKPINGYFSTNLFIF